MDQEQIDKLERRTINGIKWYVWANGGGLVRYPAKINADVFVGSLARIYGGEIRGGVIYNGEIRGGVIRGDAVCAEMRSGNYEHLLEVFEREFGDFVTLYR